MAKIRISTTVDTELLDRARSCCDGSRDSVVVERALRALIAERRATEIDQRIDFAYREIEFQRPDEWGDLASFTAAAEVS